MFSKSSEKPSSSFVAENDKSSSTKRRCKESNSESNLKEESKHSKDSSKIKTLEKSSNSFESPVDDTSNSSL